MTTQHRGTTIARESGSFGSMTPATPSRASGMTAATPAATPVAVADPFFQRVLTPAQQSYVREFTSWSVSRLEREPRALAAHSAALQASLEDLSLSNYPTFLQTHRVMTDAHTKLHSIDATMAKLGTSVLPDLLQACAAFSSAAPSILSAQSSQRLLEKEQSFLLELLEIPQLMDTCFKNQMIHEALQLDLYVKELTEKIEATMREQASTAAAAGDNTEPTAGPAPVVIPSILSSLKLEIHSIKANIVRSLLTQLRGNITVETGFPIVGLLKRTLDIFGGSSADRDGEDRSILLKYQFLMARNAYFEGALKALQAPPIPTDNPAVAASAASGTPGVASSTAPASSASTVNASLFKYLDEVLYLNRTNLFDIITLYSALFLDHDDLSSSSASGAVGAEHQANEDLGLLARWIHFRVEIMLSTLEQYLPHISDGSSLLALLNSCMEYGARLSRSKVGLDFRPLLPPLFCRVILARFSSSVDRAVSSEFETHMKTYALRIDATQLRKMGITTLQQSGDNRDKLQPFINAFLPHPPLAMLADSMIAATNCLAKCAPIQIAPEIGQALQKALATAVQKIKYAQTAGQGAANHADSSNGVSKSSQSGVSPAGTSAADLLELARTFRDSFVPFAHALLLRVYPQAQAVLSVSAVQSSLSSVFEEEDRERARVSAETAAREQAEAARKADEARRSKQAQDAREAAILQAARAVMDAPVTAAPTHSPSADSIDPVAALHEAATDSSVASSPAATAAAAASPAGAVARASPSAAATVPASALPPARASPLSAAAPLADDDNDPFAVAAARISKQNTRATATAAQPAAAAAPAAGQPPSASPSASLADAAAPHADEQSVDDMLASW